VLCWSVRVQLAKGAASDPHVLILGESGTGKELHPKAQDTPLATG